MDRLEILDELQSKEINLKTLKDNLKDLNNQYSKEQDIRINFDDDFKDKIYNQTTSIRNFYIDYKLFKELIESQINIDEKDINDLAKQLYN